ncbi:MAG: hypothetical protein NWE95_07365 [Candidatus Bathyarchaeota archaeon]|nr:hypothetical protein [Candidatus Bathyarchaeota archaeon]
MARPKIYENRAPKTFSINVDVYSKLKQHLAAQGKNISSELNEWMLKRLADFEDAAATSNAEQQLSYEALKLEHEKIYRKAIAQHKLLTQRGTLEELHALALQLGLNEKTYSNVAEVAPKVLQQWDGVSSHAHLYITWIETMQQVKALERQLAAHILDKPAAP